MDGLSATCGWPNKAWRIGLQITVSLGRAATAFERQPFPPRCSHKCGDILGEIRTDCILHADRAIVWFIALITLTGKTSIMASFN